MKNLLFHLDRIQSKICQFFKFLNNQNKNKRFDLIHLFLSLRKWICKLKIVLNVVAYLMTSSPSPVTMIYAFPVLPETSPKKSTNTVMAPK